MDIITQMTEELAAKITQQDLYEGIGQFMDEAYTEFKAYILDVARYMLTAADEAILNHKSIRRQWNVCKANVERTIQTQFGALRFTRRYYAHKQSRVSAVICWMNMSIYSPMSGLIIF